MEVVPNVVRECWAVQRETNPSAGTFSSPCGSARAKFFAGGHGNGVAVAPRLRTCLQSGSWTQGPFGCIHLRHGDLLRQRQGSAAKASAVSGDIENSVDDTHICEVRHAGAPTSSARGQWRRRPQEFPQRLRHQSFGAVALHQGIAKAAQCLATHVRLGPMQCQAGKVVLNVVPAERPARVVEARPAKRHQLHHELRRVHGADDASLEEPTVQAHDILQDGARHASCELGVGREDPEEILIQPLLAVVGRHEGAMHLAVRAEGTASEVTAGKAQGLVKERMQRGVIIVPLDARAEVPLVPDDAPEGCERAPDTFLVLCDRPATEDVCLCYVPVSGVKLDEAVPENDMVDEEVEHERGVSLAYPHH
mmetsp:Transcript_84635/g.236185  ORF Transcript_84635/g.236185 Transcript_84635/m.236185 type:complete len:365 (-) Transcript_84635:269-1363(-)